MPGDAMLRVALLALAMVVCGTVVSAQAGTLESVRKRGAVICGISGDAPGFSAPDGNGGWQGFDVDLCRAIAAAALGDGAKVRFRPVGAGEAVNALRMNEVDVLVRGTGWSYALEAGKGLRFVGVSFFDGIGLLVHREFGITSALELSNTRLCAYAGLASNGELAAYFANRGIAVEVVPFERKEDALRAYDQKTCHAYAVGLGSMAGERAKLSEPGAHVVLLEAITMHPLGPVVRQGDDQWLTLVRWVLLALIRAEEAGVTRASLNGTFEADVQMLTRRLGLGAVLASGLSPDGTWAYAVLKSVGNYGEIFERNLGKESRIGMARGFNSLWSAGGLMYAPPL